MGGAEALLVPVSGRCLAWERGLERVSIKCHVSLCGKVSCVEKQTSAILVWRLVLLWSCDTPRFLVSDREQSRELVSRKRIRFGIGPSDRSIFGKFVNRPNYYVCELGLRCEGDLRTIQIRCRGPIRRLHPRRRLRQIRRRQVRSCER